jgi:hypothetical protein
MLISKELTDAIVSDPAVDKALEALADKIRLGYPKEEEIRSVAQEIVNVYRRVNVTRFYNSAIKTP